VTAFRSIGSECHSNPDTQPAAVSQHEVHCDAAAKQTQTRGTGRKTHSPRRNCGRITRPSADDALGQASTRCGRPHYQRKQLLRASARPHSRASAKPLLNHSDRHPPPFKGRSKSSRASPGRRAALARSCAPEGTEGTRRPGAWKNSAKLKVELPRLVPYQFQRDINPLGRVVRRVANSYFRPLVLIRALPVEVCFAAAVDKDPRIVDLRSFDSHWPLLVQGPVSWRG